MLDMIKEWLDYLHSQGCYPEVAVLALALYFICRWWLDWGPKRSQWVPIVSSFVGIFGYVWPHSAQDVIRILVQGGIQAGIAIGFYSFAEKRGWVDKIGEAIERRFLKDDIAASPDPAQTQDTDSDPVSAAPPPRVKRRRWLWRRYVILWSLIIFVAFLGTITAGCSSHYHPVMTATEAGTPVEVVVPERSMERSNVPSGVDPDKVIAHFTGPGGDEAWVVDQGWFKDDKIYHSKRVEASSNPTSSATATLQEASTIAPMEIDIAKRPWYYWPVRVLIVIAFIAVVAALIYIKAVITAFAGWLSPILSVIKKLFGGNS